MSKSIATGCASLLVLGATSFAAPLAAGTFSFWDGMEGEYKLTFNYALATRLRDPHGQLIDSAVDPFRPALLPQGQLVGFTNTGLPKSINFDDGNRNFAKGSLINNRLTGVGEVKLRWNDYGAVFSGSLFYDQVFHENNDNNSPGTANKTGPNDEFTDAAEYYNGERSRTLEAYAFADFNVLDDGVLSLRFGKQLVAYGESLFFPGISGAMAPNDATKAFVPGAEIKEILLPVYQVAANLALGLDASIFGFYQLDWKPTEVFPVGDFFSVADLVGPGAEFAYGSDNPANLAGCVGLLPAPLDQLCNLGGIGGPLLNAPANILVPRGRDIRPDDDGQFGGGARYQITSITNLGLYYLRYHNHNPTVKLNPGFAFIGSVAGVPLTTGLVNQFVPVTYNVQYFDDIEMIAGSFSTVLGPFNVAGDLIYRDGIDVGVQSVISGVLSPISTRGKVYSAQTSTLYVSNPRFLFYDEFTFVGEAKYVYLDEVDAIAPEPGIIPVGGGDRPFNDQNAWGYQTLGILRARNLVPGWDLSNQVAWSHLVNGSPPVNGDFGSLFGENDRRLGLTVGMQYLQNLEFALGYNLFFGNPRHSVRNSIVKQNPVADRDYISLNIKFNL